MNLIMKKNVFRRGMAFALSTAVAVSIVPPLGTGSTARAASDASPVKNEVNLGMSSLYTDSTDGTEKVDYTVYIWYNVSIKYRRCFYDRTTAEIGAKSIHGNI